ncbi:MAG: 50S ribosomal protein L16 [Candidatus Altiarchaeota archaeon]
MAGIRPAKCYRWDSPAYTRVSNNPSESYITGIPASKINRFDMGNPIGDFDTEISIIYDVDTMVRHNALEATRIIIQKAMEKKVGVANYFFKVRVFPHHVMRQNVQASGAGADRVSEGMRRAFGKPIGRAARVRKGQAIYSIYFDHSDVKVDIVKATLKSAMKKLPGDKSIVVKTVEKNA